MTTMMILKIYMSILTDNETEIITDKNSLAADPPRLKLEKFTLKLLSTEEESAYQNYPVSILLKLYNSFDVK
jgi:hypothetical protein